MSKPSGWKRRSRPQNAPTRDSSIIDLEYYWEHSKDKLAHDLSEQDLVGYTPHGNFEIRPGATRQAATSLGAEQRYSNTQQGRPEAIQHVASKLGISDEAAERRINQEKATQAEAVLLAASIGKVKLTPAQRDRLQLIADGHYLKKLEPTFKAAKTRSSRDEYSRYMKEERREEFIKNVGPLGRGRPGKRKESLPPLASFNPTRPVPVATARPRDAVVERTYENPFAQAFPKPAAPTPVATQPTAHTKDNPFAKAFPKPVSETANTNRVEPIKVAKENPFAKAFSKPVLPSTESVDNRDLFGNVVKSKPVAKPKPVQSEMFRQREIAQFGVNARPLASITDKTRLGLEREDPRTEDEKARDRQRDAEQNNLSLL